MTSSNLPQRLKEATGTLHSAAERAPFMAALIGGHLPLASYRLLLRHLEPIYAALEAAFERHKAHPALAALWQPRLARAEGLARDLVELDRTLPRASTVLVPGATAYVERLKALAENSPVLLVAHAYVRYLGDLSGGQILKRIVAQKLGGPTAFYDFGTPEEAHRLTAEFRQALITLPLDDAELEAVVTEAVWAFRQHVLLFDELGALP